MSFLTGNHGRQEHYKQGRQIRIVNKSDIIGICQCGYIQLEPQDEMERHCGGLMLKRSKVEIVDYSGNPVKVLRRSKKINRYCHCNACVNKWR